MPELPEVETIKEDLQEHGVVGARVSGVEVLAQNLVEHPPVEEFARRLRGATIAGAGRRGKHLVVRLDTGDSLVLQLKIGGQLLLVPPAREPDSALMLRLDLEDGRRVFLRDETTYTRARLCTPEEVEARFEDLGVEPLDEGFTARYLRERIGGRKAQVKPLLLDQKVVSGVGNIYVDESLFDARVHPRRKANTLSAEEWEGVCEALVANLRGGIEDRGTTFSLYRDLLGRKGRHQENLKVFLRTGKECPGCGGKVVKEKVAGRATFLCPTCQEEEPATEPGAQLELL